MDKHDDKLKVIYDQEYYCMFWREVWWFFLIKNIYFLFLKNIMYTLKRLYLKKKKKPLQHTVSLYKIEDVPKKTNNCVIVLAKVRQLTFVTVLNFYISAQYKFLLLYGEKKYMFGFLI